MMILRIGALLSLTFACVPLDEEGDISATESTSSTGGTTTGASSEEATTDLSTSSTSVDASSSTSPADSGSPDTGATAGATTGATTTTGTSAGGTVCGDGEIADDEECDDGAGNSDTAACTSQCKLAFCGDGLIQAGKEACDLALDNGDGSYGGCTDLCQLGPHCGDKIHQPDNEECDELDPELADGSRCIACVWEANLMFISSEAVQGDLGGVEGADSKCQQLAAGSKLPSASSFRAWISTNATSPQSRFSPPVGPIIRTDGALIAESWEELTSGADLKSTVSVDESKAPSCVCQTPTVVESRTAASARGAEFSCSSGT